AFSSRCQPYHAENSNFPRSKSVQNSNHQGEPIVIDLYHSLNWREQLLGQVVFEGNQVYLKAVPIIEAIRNKRSLIIHNSPKDQIELSRKKFRFYFRTRSDY